MKLLALVLFTLFMALPARAAELTIDLEQGVSRHTTAQLLKRSDVRTITVERDVAFHRTMQYRAVPLKALLKGITVDDHLQFVAADGFSASIPAALLLDTRGSEAWLAIDDPANPWPALGGSHGKAGPFYVVWTRPEAARVNPEQWPYQLVAIRRQASGAERFPAMRPDPALPESSPVRQGFAVFQQTCLACHTMNGQGDAQLGPDLNLPYSPTEYLRADLLRAFIRNPQSLHRWPQAKMQGFDTTALSESDLDAVLAYLKHMAQRKASQ